MSTRFFALLMGVVFVVVGAAGFVPALLTPAPHPVSVDGFHGLLFGLFPVNVLHSLIHLAFGVWGVMTWFASGARLYAQAVAIVYAVLVVAGLIPALYTVFGLVPIYGHDVWLHGAIALVAAYFGFRREMHERGTAVRAH